MKNSVEKKATLTGRTVTRGALLVAASFIAGLVLFVLAFVYLEPAKLIKTLWEFHPGKVAVMVLAAGLTHMLSTIRWRLLLKYVGHELPFWKSFGYYLSGFTVSFLTPVAALGGRPVKAFLIAQKEKVPLRRGLVSVFIEMFLEFVTDTAFIVVVLPLLFFHFSFSQRLEWTIGGTFVFLLILFIFLFREFHSGRGVLMRLIKFLKIERHLKAAGSHQVIQEGEKLFVSFFSRKNKGGLAGLSISALVMAAALLQVVALFWLIGVPLAFFSVFLARAVFNIAYFIPVPGALGVAEWLQGGLFRTLGLSTGVGAAFSILYKAIDLIYAVLGLGFIAYALTSDKLKKISLAALIKPNNHAEAP